MPHVALVLFPRFQMLAYVLATETMRIANKTAGKTLFTWSTRAATREATRASNGGLVTPDRTDWLVTDRCDLVLLCAGYDPLACLPPGLRAFLSRADRQGAVLGGLDTGTMILAELGFLNGYEAVLHYEAEASFRESWPEIAITDSIYCLDRRRLTAAGGMATGDAMLAWIARTVGKPLAGDTSEAMINGTIRDGIELQRVRPSDDPIIRRMTKIMRDHMEDPLSVAQICAMLGVSQKHLLRRCKRTMHLTPAECYLRHRLERARDLLRSTAIPVGEIGLATGFRSPAGFSRIFRERHLMSPSRFRSGDRGGAL